MMRDGKFRMISGTMMFLLLTAAALRMSAGAIDADKMSFSGRSDRDALSYRVGDPVTFTVTGNYTGKAYSDKYFVYWKRTGDDGIVKEGKVPLSSLPLVVKDKFSKPGFIRFFTQLRGTDDKPVRNSRRKWVYFEGSAGADVRTLMPTEEPAGFDAFWQQALRELAALPMNAEMKELPVKAGSKWKLYQIRVDCTGGRPVTGYLQIPVGAAVKSLPVVVGYIGYSLRPADQQKPPRYGSGKYIRLHVNAHGFEPGREVAYYRDYFRRISSNGHKYAFDPVQNSDPRTAYFYGMALRAVRAVHFVKTLPQWNGKDITVTGSSQGGLQALWAAGLDPDVSLCRVQVPWCCNIAGAVKQARIKSSFAPEYVPALDYFDAAFHGKRIRGRVVVARAGLGDALCPPSGVLALFNNLQAPAEIHCYQSSGHIRCPKDSAYSVLKNAASQRADAE